MSFLKFSTAVLKKWRIFQNFPSPNENLDVFPLDLFSQILDYCVEKMADFSKFSIAK